MQELERRITALEAELAKVQDSAGKAERRLAEGGMGTERALATIADKLEGLAARIANG
jgi:hypothetical protein